MRHARPPIAATVAALALALLGLTGHARSGRALERDGLAEVLVRRAGHVVARGSAVVVAAREEDGELACYLLTAGHLVSLGGPAPAAALEVVLAVDGAGARAVPTQLLHHVDGDDADLAVLRAVGARCRPVRIGLAGTPAEDVWLAGFAVRGAVDVWPGHVRHAGTLRWTVESPVSEGASGGGVFDARTGGLVGLIQGYWTARLVTVGGPVPGEARTGTAAVVPIDRVQALLRAWGLDDLLE
ncbi:MAG: trypsin-like peptidase domain-containing protein [Candidatus Rokuibacteriota bacterium]